MSETGEKAPRKKRGKATLGFTGAGRRALPA
jgi:hypothetical protein